MARTVVCAVPDAAVKVVPSMVKSVDRSPNARWNELPDTRRVPALPMIFIASTRPPQRPSPSRAVTWSCRTVPTDGHLRAMLDVEIDLDQACDLSGRHRDRDAGPGRDSRLARCAHHWTKK